MNSLLVRSHVAEGIDVAVPLLLANLRALLAEHARGHRKELDPEHTPRQLEAPGELLLLLRLREGVREHSNKQVEQEYLTTDTQDGGRNQTADGLPATSTPAASTGPDTEEPHAGT